MSKPCKNHNVTTIKTIATFLVLLFERMENNTDFLFYFLQSHVATGYKKNYQIKSILIAPGLSGFLFAL